MIKINYKKLKMIKKYMDRQTELKKNGVMTKAHPYPANKRLGSSNITQPITANTIEKHTLIYVSYLANAT